MNPTPLPTPVPTDLAIDPNRVTPGALGFLAFAFLILAVVVLYFSLRKQLSRVNFDEGAVPGGVKPLPKYATKAERRKTALRLQKEAEAAAGAKSGATGSPSKAPSAPGPSPSTTAADDPPSAGEPTAPDPQDGPPR